MPLRNPQDLFRHELSDIYQAEQLISQQLPQMANAVSNPQVKQALQLHEQQTHQQVQNLSRCFQILGIQPEQLTCYGIEGLEREYQDVKQQNPSDDLLTLATLGAGAKTEHYEIASYRELIEQAQLMGQSECAQLLQENLRQEEETARKIEQLSHQLGQQVIGTMGGQMGRQAGQKPPA